MLNLLLPQPFYSSLDFVRDNPVSLYQKKHSPIHTYRGHNHPLSASSIYYAMASSLFNLHAWQSFCAISLQVFFHLPLGLALSTSYAIHFFTQSLSSFRSTCPYHHNLFCCSTEIMSSNPSLSLNPLFGTLFCSLMPHTHLTILISASWSATLFSFLMSQVSLPCNYFAHNCWRNSEKWW